MVLNLVRVFPVVTLAFFLSLQIVSNSELSLLRERAADFLIRQFPMPVNAVPIATIEIDEQSLKEYGQWPFARDLIGQAVHKLNLAGAITAVTVMTSEQDSGSPRRVFERMGVPLPSGIVVPDTDEILASIISQGVVIGPAILLEEDGHLIQSQSGFAVVGDHPSSYLARFSSGLVPLDPIGPAYTALGAMNMQADTDGVLRQLPLVSMISGSLFPSFVGEILRVAQEAKSIVIKSSGASGEFGSGGVIAIRIGAIELPTDANARLRFVPSFQNGFSRYSFTDLVKGNINPDQLQGHIVLLGVTASGIGERFIDPLGRRLTALEVQASFLEQILNGRFVTRPDWSSGAEFLGTMVAGLVLIAACVYLGTLAGAGVGLIVLLSLFGYWLSAFRYTGYVFDPILPGATVITTFLVVALSERWIAEKNVGWIRRAFARYVSPNLVTALTKNPDALRLTGERRELSFVFTDLAGFTELVEKLPPETLPRLLSEYLEGMTQIVFRHDGTIDKFVGDAVHVIFGAPVEQPDHAQRALDCAIEMKRFSESYAAQKQSEGIPLGVTRIGVNTGLVVIGNFGGETMFDYTAHGDAINIAARLESANKYFGTTICVSETTTRYCDNFLGREIGELILKGKTIPLKTYEPWTNQGEVVSEEWKSYLAAYKKMQDFSADAQITFENLSNQFPGDSLTKYHLNRLKSGETGCTIKLISK